jgi:hypothetical protein
MSPASAEIFENESVQNRSFLSGFLQDCTSFPWIHSIEKRLSELEAGLIDSFEESSEGHFVQVRRDSVLVGREISDRWAEVKPEEWQESRTLSEFKTALEGWKRFLEMPAGLDSELTVELSARDAS